MRLCIAGTERGYELGRDHDQQFYAQIENDNTWIYNTDPNTGAPITVA